MAYRILLVDDEHQLRRMVGEILEQEGYAVLLAADCAQGETLFCREQPDAVLLDVMLPDGDGFSLFQKLRAVRDVPVLFLSARDEDEARLRGLGLGADDYVVKPFSLEELAARVDAHLRRERRRGTASELRFDGQLVINYTDRRVTWAGHELGLVRREFDIVEFLSQNPGMVFDRERIYECVWGIDGEGDSAVISEHVRRIRAKFAAAGCERQYIETVWGVGYRWAR